MSANIVANNVANNVANIVANIFLHQYPGKIYSLEGLGGTRRV